MQWMTNSPGFTGSLNKGDFKDEENYEDDADEDERKKQGQN